MEEIISTNISVDVLSTHQQVGVGGGAGGRRRVSFSIEVSNLELDSRSLVLCSTEGAGLMFGVAQREVLRSH